mmetsp:Transcript_6754/g.18732  ORF Transcript_6754/g.18732 Transcript_6754/m.18732 type:complete len:290 (-) Transcript_6754:970-1839(-)
MSPELAPLCGHRLNCHVLPSTPTDTRRSQSSFLVGSRSVTWYLTGRFGSLPSRRKTRRYTSFLGLAAPASSGGTNTPSSKNRLILCMLSRVDIEGGTRMRGVILGWAGALARATGLGTTSCCVLCLDGIAVAAWGGGGGGICDGCDGCDGCENWRSSSSPKPTLSRPSASAPICRMAASVVVCRSYLPDDFGAVMVFGLTLPAFSFLVRLISSTPTLYRMSMTASNDLPGTESIVFLFRSRNSLATMAFSVPSASTSAMWRSPSLPGTPAGSSSRFLFVAAAPSRPGTT